MRGNRNNTQAEHREQNQNERHGKFIMCAFYDDLLPTGVKSPGYIETISKDRRPAAYVVPLSSLEERNIQRTVDPLEPSISEDFKVKWAREHVRLIKLMSNLGLSSKEIMDDYLVRVPYPMSSASTGELIRKPGRAVSQASVPDGITGDDIETNKMLDRSVNISEKRKIAKARYGSSGDRTIGVPFVGTQEQFPNTGDIWLGSG
jgi:hypothetical protein